VTNEEAGLDIVREALQCVRGGGSTQSEAGNIPCSQDWEGIMAQQVECREKINMNYARIGSIEEEMRLLREQMMNCWREGPSMGEAGPSMGEAGPSMGEPEPYMGEPEPYMYDDEPTMVQEEPTMCQDLVLFSRGQEGYSVGHEDSSTGQEGHSVGHEGGSVADVGTSCESPIPTPIRLYVHYSIRFTGLDFGNLYKLLTNKGRAKESVR